MRRANRKDTVHAPIVEGLREYGVQIWDMPSPGDVLCKWNGTWTPMEFKSGRDVRGKDESISNNRKRAPSGIPIVHTLAEGLALLGITPKETA